MGQQKMQLHQWLFFPKAKALFAKAGLLTYSLLPSLPTPSTRGSGKGIVVKVMELTAAGTVADFRGIPF